MLNVLKDKTYTIRHHSIMIPITFKHPGTILGRNQLQSLPSKHAGMSYIKNEINKWKGPNVIKDVNIGPFGVGIGHKEFIDDAMQTYRYVLLFLYTAKSDYAQKASEIIKAWSTGCRSFIGSNSPLECGWGSILLVRSAELLKYSWSSWTLDASLNAFLDSIILPNLHGRYVEISRWHNNWILTIQEALLQIAIYRNNIQLFNKTVKEYKEIANKTYVGGEGQNTETQRDICPHCQFQIASHIQIAEIAFHQGVTDLYTDSLRKSVEYHAAILNGLVPDNVKLKDVWFMPCSWEIAYNHYQNRVKTPMPETKKLLSKKRPEGMSFNWGPGFLHENTK